MTSAISQQHPRGRAGPRCLMRAMLKYLRMFQAPNFENRVAADRSGNWESRRTHFSLKVGGSACERRLHSRLPQNRRAKQTLCQETAADSVGLPTQPSASVGRSPQAAPPVLSEVQVWDLRQQKCSGTKQFEHFVRRRNSLRNVVLAVRSAHKSGLKQGRCNVHATIE